MQRQLDSKVIFGTALQVASRLSTAFIALVIVALLARSMERDAFGRYSATLALFQVLDILVDGGSLQAAVRAVAKKSTCACAAVRAAVEFRFFTASISIVIATAVAWILNDPQVGLVMVASFTLFTHAAGVGVAVLHADIDYKQSESFRVLGSMLGLFATIGLVGGGITDAGSMLVAVYAGSALSNLGLAVSVKSDVPPGGDPIDKKVFIKESVALGLGGVVRQTYYSLNPILARALGGDLAGARFAPAYRLSGLSILVSVYFGAAALPAMVRLYHSNRRDLNRFTLRWSILLLMIGSSLAGLLYIFRERIIILLFGIDYADSASVLGPMCLTTIIIHLGGLVLVRLIAEGRDRAALFVSIAGLVTNVIVNFILTPQWGAEGAAWASVATETVVALGACAALAIK